MNLIIALEQKIQRKFMSVKCKLMNFIIMIALFLASSELPSTAQGEVKYGSLTGCVRDSKTGQPLSGARVTLFAGLESRSSKTGNDGHYSFNRIPRGKQFPFTVSCHNYKELSTHVTIQPGALTQNDVTLSSMYLHLIYPNGGEKIFAGSEQHISWISVGITSLKIEFSINSGRDWMLISPDADASRGYYIWNVPDIPSSEYLIMITDTANENNCDVSDNIFSNDST